MNQAKKEKWFVDQRIPTRTEFTLGIIIVALFIRCIRGNR